jgi:hypothetical protein
VSENKKLMIFIPLQKRMANLESSLQVSTMSDDRWRECREVRTQLVKEVESQGKGSQE